MPPIQDTIGSPKQWAYRTKITPHFDALPKYMQAAIKSQGEGQGQGQAQAADVKEAEPLLEEERMNGLEGEANGAQGTCKHAEEQGGQGKVEEGRGTKVVKAGDKEWELRIGFERKGRPGVMDIEVRLFSFCREIRNLPWARIRIRDVMQQRGGLGKGVMAKAACHARPMRPCGSPGLRTL